MEGKVFYTTAGLIALGFGYMVYSKNEAKKIKEKADKDAEIAKAKAEQDAATSKAEQQELANQQQKELNSKKEPLYVSLEKILIERYKKQSEDASKYIDKLYKGINSNINGIRKYYPEAKEGETISGSGYLKKLDGSFFIFDVAESNKLYEADIITFFNTQAMKDAKDAVNMKRVLSIQDFAETIAEAQRQIMDLTRIYEFVDKKLNCFREDTKNMSIEDIELIIKYQTVDESYWNDINNYKKATDLVRRNGGNKEIFEIKCKNETGYANEFYGIKTKI